VLNRDCIPQYAACAFVDSFFEIVFEVHQYTFSPVWRTIPGFRSLAFTFRSVLPSLITKTLSVARVSTTDPICRRILLPKRTTEISLTFSTQCPPSCRDGLCYRVAQSAYGEDIHVSDIRNEPDLVVREYTVGIGPAGLDEVIETYRFVFGVEKYGLSLASSFFLLPLLSDFFKSPPAFFL
jgi:hypothetical protein